MIAFFAILFTGTHPGGLFDFNVGVMRWRWRVFFYALSALGTDKSPPFSLRPNSEYSADSQVDYPQRLHRGVVGIKWWLLAIPHYLVLIAFSTGGGQGDGQRRRELGLRLCIGAADHHFAADRGAGPAVDRATRRACTTS